MSFWAYFFQLRASIRKFLNSKEITASENERTQTELEVRNEIKCHLQQQCKKSAKEVQYIGCFTYWPIAKSKTGLQQNSLVYLDVNRTKLASPEQINKRHKRNNQPVRTPKKPTFVSPITAIKKIPHS